MYVKKVIVKKRSGYKKRSSSKAYPRIPYKKRTVKLVKKVIQRMAEKKIQTYTINTVQPLVLRTGSATTVANVFPMTPEVGYWTIDQGSAQGNRIGNKVRTHSAKLNIQITPTAYNATTNPNPTPCFVRIWFVKYKPFATTLPPNNSLFGATALFLQQGSTDIGLTGTFQDLQLPINTDGFTLYGYRTYKVGFAVYDAGTGTQPNNGNFASNDFKLCILKTIDLTKMLPKVMTWDDTTGEPTSHGLSMVVQPIYASGAVPGASIAPINFKFSLNYTYSDD